MSLTALPALTHTMLNAVAALRKAFQLADTNYNAKYDSGCQTAFVFLTDGEQTEVPTSTSFVNTFFTFFVGGAHHRS